MGHNTHAQTFCFKCGCRTDFTHSDNTHGLISKTMDGREKLCYGLSSRWNKIDVMVSHALIYLKQFPAECQKECSGVAGDFVDTVIGNIGYDNPHFSGGFQMNAVIADPQTGKDAALG